jgi:hypothetical protein
MKYFIKNKHIITKKLKQQAIICEAHNLKMTISFEIVHQKKTFIFSGTTKIEKNIPNIKYLN